MKNILGLIISLMIFVNFTYGQKEKETVIYLKNGYSVRGVITEQSDKGVKIKTSDGQIFEYSNDEIDEMPSDKKKSVVTKKQSKPKAISSITSNTVFKKGNKLLNLGLGIGNSLYPKSTYTSKFPPISAFYELGVVDDLFDSRSSLGVGGFFGLTGAQNNYWGDDGWKYLSIVLGPRAAIHYQFVEKLDTYGGLMLGYNIESARWTGEGNGPSNTDSEGGFAWSLFLGGRYYFNEKLAGLVELGYGVSYITVGVALKL